MTFRPDKTDGGIRQVPVTDLLAGLDSKSPAHRMNPGASPDLLNVVLDRRAVASRGGFVPLADSWPGVNSIRNPGFRVESRAQRSAGAAQATYLTVAGGAVAGHRPVWDDLDVRNGVTLDLFLVIDDLTLKHGGDGAGAADGYTLSMRPILSKGPQRRTVQTTGQMSGTDGWSTTSRWGPSGAGQHAMPFCLYLFQNAGTWEIRFSFHTWVSGNWELTTLATSLSTLGGLKTGQKYHVVAGYSVADNSAVLRVGTWFDVDLPTYVTVTGAVAGTRMDLSTTGPIQLFDCPQEFAEAPGTPSATRPPGLGLASYFTAVRRFEGAVEDIAIYRGIPAGAATGSLNRTRRIGTPVAPLLQHWPVESAQPGMLEEKSGQGNHLFFAPGGPVFDKSGGFKGGALVFNGRTAYALCEQGDVNFVNNNPMDGRGGRPNWRTALVSLSPADYVEGAWAVNVRMGSAMNGAHGLEVAFWPESIEPNHEQVVVEAHAAMRVSILPDGRIRGYVRASTTPAIAYISGGTSTAVVAPGRRYHVVLMRLSRTLSQLWVNGTLEDEVVVVAPGDDFQQTVSGLTVGAGAQYTTSTTVDGTGFPTEFTEPADRVATDHRTYFFGRVEGVRALIGSIPYGSTVGAAGISTLYTQVSNENYRLPFLRLLQVRSGTPQDFQVASPGDPTPDDTVPRIGLGHGLHLPQTEWANAFRVIDSEASDNSLSTLRTFPSPSPIFDRIAQLGQLWRAVCAYDFDEEVPEGGYVGGHDENVESQATRRVHVHRFYKDCSLGFGGPVQLRSIESDIQSGVVDTTTILKQSHRPEDLKSPRELAPQWVPGILTPNLDENPISFISPWRDELSGEQFVVAGCRRSIHWVKPRFKRQSPWDDGDSSLWMSGHRDDYARGTTVSATGSWSSSEAVVDLWCYPHRLDGNRVLLMRGSRFDDSVQYLLMLRDGQLWVMGQLAGGDLWAYVQGTVLSTPTRNLPDVTVRLQAWNHIAVRISATGVVAWINGTKVTMADASLLVTGVSLTSANYPACTDVWIGGVTADQWDTKFPVAGGVSSFALQLRSFCGLLRHARECSSAAHLPFSSTQNGSPPSEAEAPPLTARWQASCSPQSVLQVGSFSYRPKEFIPIRSDLDDMQNQAGSAVVFRQRLVVAHPKIKPQRVAFLGFDRPAQFVCHRLGINEAGDQTGGYRRVLVNQPAGSSPLPAAQYQVWVSFVAPFFDFEESPLSPGPVVRLAVPGTLMQFSGIARSDDPQVGWRRLYLSKDGGVPVFVAQVDDNATSSWLIDVNSASVISGTPDPTFQLPAPIAAKVAVGLGQLCLARTKDNPNQFCLSGDSPGLWPLALRTPIDSQDGQGIVGIAAHLSNLFVFKRNGTWAVAGGSARPVNTSAGCGGGTAIYDNQVFGVGDRGVWAFNGAALTYLSDPLEREFEDIDVSEDGLLAQQGAFYYPNSQWWLSVRRYGEKFNRYVYILHTGAGAAPAYTKALLPEHVCLGVLADPGTERPLLAVGTSGGRILALDSGAVTDGVADITGLVGTGVLAGSVVTPSSPIVAQLRGATIAFFTDGAITHETRIVSSGPTSFEVESPPAAGPVTFAIGGFDAYWSSPWLEPQQMGAHQHLQEVDLEFEPNAGNLQLDVATAMRSDMRTVASRRAWSADFGSETTQLDQSTGFRNNPQPVTERRRGRYARIRFGTFRAADALPAKFAVTAYALRVAPEGLKGAPGGSP